MNAKNKPIPSEKVVDIENSLINEKIRAEAPAVTYEEMYEAEGTYDRPYRKSHYYPMFQACLDEVRRMGGRQVIDVGCGSGSFAHLVFDQTELNYNGFDFSKMAILKAKERTNRPEAFRVANAIEPDSYPKNYDTIVCTEVLEHIELDREVIELWRPGVACICSVPNFYFETHVRYFLKEEEVRARYGELIQIERIIRVARPLILGRTITEYLRALRWSRNDLKRFLALLGYKTFDNLAGWFVFSGRRR